MTMNLLLVVPVSLGFLLGFISVRFKPDFVEGKEETG